MMEIYVKNPLHLALLIVIVCHSTHAFSYKIPQHHKIRHKHNILAFNDNHVNEIREAFDDFKNTIQRPKGFDDENNVTSLRRHHEMNDDLTYSASDNRLISNETPTNAYRKGVENSKFTTRYKRVQTAREATNQGRESESNYDDEYDDDANEEQSRKTADDSVSKVQVSCVESQLGLTS